MTRKLLSTKQTSKTIRSWLPLLLIFLLFIVPLFLANYVKNDKNLFNLGTTNRGQLLTPAVSLTNLNFKTVAGAELPLTLLKQKWGLIYIAPHACEEQCVINIYKMQQLKNAIRLKTPSFYTMVITNSHDAETNPVYALIRQHYPTIFYVAMTDSELQQFLKSMPPGTQSMNIDVLYVANPNGYLVMSYPPEESGQSILRGLKTRIKG